MGLEEAHLANLLSTDARRSDIRDCAGREFKSRVCRVDFVRENRNADRMQFSNLDILAHPIATYRDRGSLDQNHIYV